MVCRLSCVVLVAALSVCNRDSGRLLVMMALGQCVCVRDALFIADTTANGDGYDTGGRAAGWRAGRAYMQHEC